MSSASSFAEEADLIQGNWTGDWNLDKDAGGGKQTAKVVALGNGDYLGSFTAYDGSEQQNETFKFNIRGTADLDGNVHFETTIQLGGRLGTFEWKAVIKGGKFTGRYTNNKNYTGGFTLKREEKKVESLGMKPLPAAVVLFDGKTFNHWRRLDDEKIAWEIVDDAMRINPSTKLKGEIIKSHLVSKQTFKSAQIHLEYRTPFMPGTRDQDRGQSGLFLNGCYEIQILDSFGVDASDEVAGAIFKRKAPTQNVSLPPREWQALDITYQGPKFGEDGKIKMAGEITVIHNDVMVLDRIRVQEPTDGAIRKPSTEPSGLILQDAGHSVEFRNIWLVVLE
jgi:hypothetical protein